MLFINIKKKKNCKHITGENLLFLFKFLFWDFKKRKRNDFISS